MELFLLVGLFKGGWIKTMKNRLLRLKPKGTPPVLTPSLRV